MPTKKRKTTKIAIVVSALVLLYTLFGFVGLPLIVRSILPNKISEAINRKVHIEKVEINPYYLTLCLKNLVVTDQDDKTFMSLDEFFVNLQMSSLLKKALILKNVHITKPFLQIVRNADGSFNFSDLAGTKTPETPSDTKTAGPPIPDFVIQNLRIETGRIAYTDQSTAAPFETVLEPFDITLKSVSSQPNSKAGYSFSATTPDNEIFDWKGTFSLIPLYSEGTLSVKNVLLKKYAPFYQDFIDFEVAAGTLGIQSSYQLKVGNQPEVLRLSKASISLDSFESKIQEGRERLIAIPSLAITDIDVDVLKQEITIGSLSGAKGYLLCKRFADGSLSLDRLIAAKTPKTDAVPPRQTAAPAPKPWQVNLKNIVLEDHTIQFQDLMPADPVNVLLGHIKLEGKDLTTKPDSQGRVSASMRWNQKGNVSVKGALTADPVSAELAVNVSGLDIRSVQPYFTDKVKLIVTDGDFNANGKVHFSQKKSGSPIAGYQGEASITGFASIDRKKAQDFLKWKSLYFDKVNIAYQPTKIIVGKVALADFYSRLIINPDGTINIKTIFSPESKATEKTPATAAKKASQTTQPVIPDITVNAVVLQGGSVSFADHLTRPNFETNLAELGGTISGLSSKEESRADVFLKGSYGGSAPLEIKGEINPLIANRFADLTITFSDIELSPFSPYSGKYLGYILEKGQLTLELGYKLLDNKIQGNNRIFFDQLTLGDKVDSPEATSLPVKLGIALLKDRNGQIDLDLPVKGDLNDPEFSIGKVIFTMIGNLFTKIISAPFAALSSIFGGGTELSYMDFEYGSTQISQSMHEQLNKLITAIYERPALQLEIQGAVDPENDRLALQQVRFDNLVKAQKLKEMVKKGQKAIPLAEVRIEPQAYEKYLTKAYKTSDIPKPRNQFGMIKKLPSDEMEKLLYTSIGITDEDLRLLAHKRANVVKNHIIASEKVDPKRIFIVEPASMSDQKNSDKYKSRVNFSLK